MSNDEILIGDLPEVSSITASDVLIVNKDVGGGDFVTSRITKQNLDTSAGYVTKDGAETLTNKTLTAPVISTISNTGTLTLPTSTDTLIGRVTTDTLTNKTLASPVLTTPALGAATGASLALGGATIGSNALAVTGTVNISGQVSTGGSIAAAGNIQVGNIAVVNWGSRSQISSPADGNLTVTNGAVTGFNQFNFGGNTAAFPALKRSGNALHARRADDSDWSSFWCGSLIASYGVYLGNGGSQIQQSTDGVIRFLNGAASDFGRMQLGGTSSSFPSIKRNGAAINFRLADDSADAAITAAAGTFSGTVSASLLKPAAFTVATLPSASASGQGAQSFVTDAASPAWGATVAGGGSVKSPVFSDGANWKVG